MDKVRNSFSGKMLLKFISFAFVLDRVTALNYECSPRNLYGTGVGVANCSDQLLGHVPPNLPHNILEFDLSNNQITELINYSFVKYEYLEILHLHNNSLSRLQARAFEKLRKLLYLDLSFNNLVRIPSQTFHEISALLTLSLKGNKITSIQSNSFNNVPKLTSLYLAGNHIQFIHPNAFAGLFRLQHLALQNNALRTLNSSVFEHFSQELKEIKLFNNPWYCDCNLRWLILWLNEASDSVSQKMQWIFNTDEPVCQGPSLTAQRPLATLTGDWFICPLRLYSKARNMEIQPGREVQLFCKYMADPPVQMQWLKNQKPVDMTQTWKYELATEGDVIITSRLHILNFQFDDIGEYECNAENKLGKISDTSLVTLKGVDPTKLVQPVVVNDKDDKDRTRNAIIASSTIGGVVLLLVLVGILILSILRCKRYRKKKKESIRMTFEEHLKANGIIEPKPKTEHRDMYDDVQDGTMSIDAELDESGSMYDSLQRPRVPSSVNTNTYISFKSELSDPEDMTQMYASAPKNTIGKGSDGSQCESTSPLLENISPILIDPHDPFYEANLYVPRLDSLTANYFNSTHRGHSYNIDDYESGFLPYRTHTLPHNSYLRHSSHDDSFMSHRNHTLPHGYSPSNITDFQSPPVMRSQSAMANHKSLSVGHLGTSPPKKPPRMFHSRETMSLHSQGSQNGEKDRTLKLSLPKPGTVDKYGTAV